MTSSKQIHANRRKNRVRKKLARVSSKPRLNVYRSNKHIYAQIISDSDGKTLITTSEKDLKTSKDTKLSKLQKATLIGEALAQKALKKKISQVAFDRGSYQYHGRIKALAEGARSKGLKF